MRDKLNIGLFEVSGATFSDCGRYRYKLWRTWSDKPLLTFIMLNPSTSDEIKNDPTVERCERRARQNGYGGIVVLNLMAYRATDPRELAPLPAKERFGPENAEHLVNAVQSGGTIICGWGAHGHLGPVAWLTTQAERAETPLWCLGTTKDGHPRHPLYVPYSKPLEWFAGRAALKMEGRDE